LKNEIQGFSKKLFEFKCVQGVVAGALYTKEMRADLNNAKFSVQCSPDIRRMAQK